MRTQLGMRNPLDEVVEEMRMRLGMRNPLDEVVEMLECGVMEDEILPLDDRDHAVDEAFEVVSVDDGCEGLGVYQVVEASWGHLPQCRRLSSMQV